MMFSGGCRLSGLLLVVVGDGGVSIMLMLLVCRLSMCNCWCSSGYIVRLSCVCVMCILRLLLLW